MLTNKIVALNSGGLDSVVMLHELRNSNREAEIDTIFFSYGQRAYKEELLCASKVCEKLDLNLQIIELPKMTWSNSGLLKDTVEVYLEMRNMIFLSYAVSYAESIGVKEIYVAFIEPLGYYDTTYEFLENMNKVIEGLGIEIIAPLHRVSKEGLIPSIRAFCIGRDEFFSCLKTEEITGEKCGNCDVIDYMYKYYIDPFLLDDLFMYGDFDRFREVKKNLKLKTAKICINDRCNLRCSYCFIEDREPRELSEEGYKRVLDQLHKLNIGLVDFFGKEPLFNERIINIVEYAREKNYPFDFTFITNGVNLDKYYDKIVEGKFESITVSYEGEAEKTGRDFIPSLNTIRSLIKDGVKVNISLDLHKTNKDNIVKSVTKFKELNINEIYIKPIIPVGKSIEIVKKDFYLSSEEFREVIDSLSQEDDLDHNTKIKIGIPLQYNELAKEDRKSVV